MPIGEARLPEELLELVFSYLEISASAETSSNVGFTSSEREKLATLASISAANQTFHRLAIQLLYRTLYIPYPCENYLELFLRTFSTNRKLTEHVKHVHVRGWIAQRTLGDRGQSLDTGWNDSDVLQKALSLAAGAGIDAIVLAPIIRGLREDLPDAELALLLALCPNIELLDLIIPDYFANTLVFRLMAMTQSADDAHLAPAKMCHLRELRLQPTTTRGCRRLKEASRHTIRRTGLEVFRGERLNLYGCWLARDMWNDEYPGRLRALHLHNSRLSPEDLEAVLELNTEMETVDIHWSEEIGYLSLSRIGNALRRLGGSIRSLSLDPRLSVDYPNRESAGRFGSLCDLQQLQYLKVPLKALIYSAAALDIQGSEGKVLDLADALPSSLSRLSIIPDPPAEDRLIEAEIRQKTSDVSISNAFPLLGLEVIDDPELSFGM